MKVLLLHGYSAENAGDGLLVSESIDLLREAFPEGVTETLIALHPNTFDGSGIHRVIDGSVRRGYSRELRATLRSLDAFDLVVAVGGGYLRAGRMSETVKSVIAHGLQLRRAAQASVPVVYLPQSIGPLRFGTRAVARRMLGNIDSVYVRDDRSVAELDLPNVKRTSDLALMSSQTAARSGGAPNPRPVLSIRPLGGRVGTRVRRLAELLAPFDGYVQSTGAGNDDTEAMASVGPARMLDRDEFLEGNGPRRVVVAVRLHAAIMALNAGHWVIHLAYERKGFGAFSDLALSDYVFNVNDFDPEQVASITRNLLTDSKTRVAYDERLTGARDAIEDSRARLVADLRVVADRGRS